MDAAQPTHRKKSTDPAGEVARKQAPRRSRKPAYLQCKLALSHPQDAEEREADQVAREVANTPRVADTGPRETEEMISSAPAPVPLARRLRRRNNAPGPARQGDGEEEELQTRRLACQVEDEQEAVSTARRLRRQGDGEEEELQMGLARVLRRRCTQRGEGDTEESDETAVSTVDEQIEARIEARRGAGNPLADGVREDMEARFGQDFSRVGIHTDAEAAELCRELHARAFAVGNDVFFAPGEYAPETESGRELLAHELTHVVQQGDGARPKLARSAQAGGAAVGGGGVFNVTEPLEIPPIKSRHGPRYQAMARARQLRRPAGSVSASRNTSQRSTWLSTVRPDVSRIPPDQRPSTATGYSLRLNVRGGRQRLEAPDEESFLQMLKIPTWDQTGADAEYQVDHIVEHQLGGPDAIDNMELLDSRHNASVGSSFRYEIRDAVRRTIDARPPTHPSFSDFPGAPASKPSAAWVLENWTTEFTNVAATGGHQRARTEGSSSFWTRTDMQNLGHVLGLLDASLRDRQGTASLLSLLSPTGGLVITKIPHGRSAQSFSVPRARQTALSGFRISEVMLQAGYNESDRAGSVVGALSTRLDLGPSIRVANGADPFPIDLVKDDEADFSVRVSESALANLPQTVELDGASPVDLSEFSIGQGLHAAAMLRPTHPMLEGLQIPGRIENGRLGIYHTFDVSSMAQRLPVPGIQIDDAAITLGFDGERLLAGGGVAFTVRNFGEGVLSAEIDSSGAYGFSGRFTADTRLFDQAQLRLWYRSEDGFGGEGTLAITNSDKITGIRSASIAASFANGGFVANGSVEPDLPGVEEAGLSVSYSEEGGLVIGGRLALTADTPGISSGSVEVTLTKHEDAWKVRADGTAQPAIPGVDSQLTVSYDDGAFTAGFSGAYRRGMLSGQVSVGASNRALDDQGQPTGEAEPDSPIIVYGSGQVTVQIAPWLQGTVGIRFAPDGEVTVSGEIGIPGAVEIFARRQIEKSLFNIAVQVPIVPGIVAEIGGGLSAQAGIGPGTLERLNLGITYNPAQEADTRVSGGAQLRVPADAGLRLSVRAGVGIGITGASVTGGLEVGGTLGVEGAAEAAVEVDWTPAQGLDLRANLSVHAQPSFTFDISGYVSARALGVSVYEERWQLASYTFGSDYRFGISLPVRYREGEPFEIGLDDVRFEVPNVDPGQILRGLIRRIV